VQSEPVSLDTSAEAERRQFEKWQTMTPVEKLALVSGMSIAVSSLALAGIRRRYPNGSPREHFLRFAVLTLGRELACAAYPDAAGLDAE
jgi:hypothetical protein